MVTSKSLQTVMAEHQQDIATAHAPNKCSFLFDVTWRMCYAAMKLKMAAERRGVKRKATSMQKKLSSDHINSKGNEFLEDRRYSNNLIDILSLAIGEDEEQIIAAQNVLEKIFVHLLERGDLFVKEQSHDSSDCLEYSEQVYATWLQDRYMDTKKQLLENLHHSVINVKNSALSILMKLVKTETLFPVKPIISGCSFPADFFMEIIKNVVLEQNDDHLVVQLQEYLQYTDISFNILKSLVLILKTQPKKKTNGTFLLNTFSLLSKLDIQKVAKKKSDNSLKVNNFTKCSDNEELSLLNYHYIRKLYTVSWTKFLTFKLPTMLYKEVLVILDEDILPYFTKPLLLTDFLTKSYKIGGAVSLLALSGLFTLMQNYNLEYPDFYKKFYALVEPSVFHSQHKTKFFFLADLFLSSTHIPEYLVAAFIKRLSRLSLVAPPAALLVIIPFICNLLIRHPQLKILMDRPDSNEVLEDPYVMTETDPAKCHAMESSLWEIQTLQSHWHPDVAIKAKFVEKTLPKMETDLSNLYSLDSHKLFQKELVRNYKEVPLNYDKPTGLFQRNEDLMKDIWLLE